MKSAFDYFWDGAWLVGLAVVMMNVPPSNHVPIVIGWGIGQIIVGLFRVGR